MLGFYQVGDRLTGVWSPNVDGNETGATVGFNGVTEILVDKADGPMGYYAIALVYRGDELWQSLPLHMMQYVEIATRENNK